MKDSTETMPVGKLLKILRAIPCTMPKSLGDNCQTAINLLERMLGTTASISVSRLPFLAESLRLFTLLPTTLRRDGQTYRAKTAEDYKYSLKAAIKEAVATNALPPSAAALPVDFPALPRPSDPAERRRWSDYNHFAIWASSEGIAYGDVAPDTFLKHFEHLQSSVQSASARRQRIRGIQRIWQKHDLRLISFPDLPTDYRFYGIPYSQWPPNVRREFDGFIRLGLRHGTCGRRKKRLLTSQKSENTYSALLSLVLGYAANVETTDISGWSLLGDVLNVELLCRFNKWHAEERCGGETRHAHQILFRQAGRIIRTLGGDMDKAQRLETMADQQVPCRVRVIDVRSLKSYDDVINMAWQAMDIAEKTFDRWIQDGRKPDEVADVASLYEDSFLFLLFVRRPMRACNFRMMRLGQHLHKDHDGKWQLKFTAPEVKGRRPFNRPFPPDAVPCLIRFLGDVRPILNVRNADVLFLTREGNGLVHSAITKRLSTLGLTHLGVRTTPHFFRYLVPSAYLAQYPEELDSMRAVLGHRTVDVTLARYVFVFIREKTRRIKPFLREKCPHFNMLGALKFSATL